jgi:hypothetical protein
MIASALAACDPDPIHSSLTLDGRPFGPVACRSGQDAEFFGVDLKDDSGTSVRIVANPDQSVSVVVTRAGQAPVTATSCARMNLDESRRDDRGYYSLSGSAELDDCSAGGSVITGSVTFEDCDHNY